MLSRGDIRNSDFSSELKFTASRSGGKGGQNVNKVSTKVELHFDYLNSIILNNEQKRLIGLKLSTFIHKDGILTLIVQEERSQLMNKKKAIQKFYSLLEKAFRRTKRRVPTKPGAGWHKRRLESKQKKYRKQVLGFE
jgi:ribosome-associated protein